MACSLLMLSSCRPKTEELAPEKQTAKNKNAGENYVPSPKLGGKQNPYSLKSIREAKDAFREISMLSANDIKEFDNLRQDIAQNLANTPIDPQDLQLYVSWQPSVKSQTENFAQILKSDSTIRVLPFPLDSTSYTTQEMEGEDEVNDYLSTFKNNGKIYAILTPQKLASLNLQTPAEVLDTLYFPKENEVMLEFFTHLVSNNIDEKTMMTLSLDYPELYTSVREGLLAGGFQKNKQKRFRSFIRNIIRVFSNAVGIFSPLINGVSNIFGWGRNPAGSIQVRDDVRGQNVPVVNVTVNVIHWGRIVSARTTTNGNYFIPVRLLFGSLFFVSFHNQNATIIPLDIRGAWAGLAAVGAFVLPNALHVVGFRSSSALSNLQVAFTDHKQSKMWSTILNGLHEYRTVAQQKNIRNPSKLTIFAVWGWKRNAGSAPMFGYLNSVNYLADIMGRLTNTPNFLSSSFANALNGFLPDVVISDGSDQDDVISSTSYVKALTYHELGHTSHFFQVGPIYWTEFIGYTVSSNYNGPIYGTNINSQPGRFCALPEAWAQYMLYQVGMQYYPTQQFLMPDALAGGWQSRTLVEHAEINERFFNTFIPCGLFYDLMDVDPNTFANTDERVHDEISGYTTKQIFDLMQPRVQSMQDFRARFESTYGSNTNTQKLFFHYGL